MVDEGQIACRDPAASPQLKSSMYQLLVQPAGAGPVMKVSGEDLRSTSAIIRPAADAGVFTQDHRAPQSPISSTVALRPVTTARARLLVEGQASRRVRGRGSRRTRCRPVVYQMMPSAAEPGAVAACRWSADGPAAQDNRLGWLLGRPLHRVNAGRSLGCSKIHALSLFRRQPAKAPSRFSTTAP